MLAPEVILKNFEKSQWAILVLILVAAWTGLRSRKSSQFRVREADRTDADRIKKPSQLAEAKLSRPAPPPPPLALPGIRLSGEPHEILGIRPDASEAEIMKAYKEAIKMYHPDRIQGQAQDQLKFYQEASAKLNEAKNQMIKKFRK